MNDSGWVQLIIGVLGIGGSILTAGITYFLTKKKQMDDANKQIKQDYYLKFIEAWSRRHTSNDKQYVDDIIVALNNLPLVCSAEVATYLEQFKEYTSNQNEHRVVEVQNAIYTQLLKAMRKDLYGTDKVNEEFPQITMQSNFREQTLEEIL